MSEYINNSAKRLAALRQMIRDLHAGADPEEIKARFRAEFSSVSAVEIAQMEQQLIAEGLPAEEVKALCDVHLSIFQGAIAEVGDQTVPPGHPVHTFKYENFALQELLALIEQVLSRLPDAQALAQLRSLAEQLGEVNKIYLRKENLLFPFLERHGVGGPSKVMWGLHDDIRAMLKAFQGAVREGDIASIQKAWPPLAQAIRQMILKEEQVLYPASLKVLSEAEWAAIYQQSDEIGYCLVRPLAEWKPSVPPAEAPALASAYGQAPAEEIRLDVGALTPEQVNLLVNHLPVEITFVDEHDTVRFYSQGRGERLFPRTPAIIGRKVQNCHPPASVHIVNRLIQEMREGKRDVATFWIQTGEKFVHIRYFAVRDAQGQYRGVMEVAQDIAPLRALEGERRLLAED